MQGRPRKRTRNFRQLPRFTFCGPAECFFRASHFSEFARYADEKCPILGLEKEGGPPPPLKCTLLWRTLPNLVVTRDHCCSQPHDELAQLAGFG